MSSTLALSKVVAASVVGTAPTASPDEHRPTLSWRAPAGCPSASRVRDTIERLAGPLPSDDPLHVDATVERTPTGRYSLTLELSANGSTMTRTVDAAGCDTLADAVALIVATLVEPADVVERVEPSLVASPAPADPAPIGPENDRGVRWRGWALRPSGIVGGGIVHDIDGGVALALSLQFDPLRVELEVSHYFAQRFVYPEQPAAGLDVSLTTAQLRLCGVPHVGHWEFPLCASGESGPMIAKGTGVDSPRRVASPWVGVSAGAHVAWRPTDRFALWLGGEIVGSVVLPRFTLEDNPAFYEAGLLGGRARLGLEARFP